MAVIDRKTLQYVRQYRWANVFAMLRNGRKAPLICPERFEGRLVVITGATSGIGLETARKYASMGANLLCINRNPEKSARLKAEIERDFGTRCDSLIADLSSLDDIFRVGNELAKLERPIDVLIHNAGIYLTRRETTSDGLEKVFAVHYLASFIINYLLIDKLKAQPSARIIMVGSEGHRFAAWGLKLDDLNWEQRRYTGLGSYGSAKLAQMLAMLRFAELFQATGVTINTMHPGAVKSEAGQDNGLLYRWFKRQIFDKLLTGADVSAEALYYLGAAPELEASSGRFFNLTTLEDPAPPALDRDSADRLWDETLRMTGLTVGTRYQPKSGARRSADRYDAIVVGGGIAGLTATAYLARAGKKVLLLEKNKELGGLVNSFSHNGFRFDAGVRALEDAGIILPMLKDLGIRLETVKSPVSVGLEDDILNIEGIHSLEAYKAQLKKFYPNSSSEIDAVLATIRKIMRHMDVLYGIENPIFKDLKCDISFIFSKLLPWFPRFLFTVGKINRMSYPVEDYLNTAVSDPSLRDIISQHFFKNTPAFFALSYFSLYLDYFYPKGGVGRLAEVVRDKVLELGGEIRTETTVTSVAPDIHSVMDSNGVRYRYRDLIWAADLKTFYSLTSTQNLPPWIQARFAARKAKMLEHKGSESVFTLFLEVDEPLESFAAIARGHFFYTPSRLGLGETHRAKLQALLAGFPDIDKSDVLDWLDGFLSLNTFEISIPGLKDPDACPAGKTGLIISFLAEYELFSRIREAGWYDEFITELEERVLKVLAGSVYPMLKDRVMARFSFSPLSIKERVGSSEGAIVGWQFLPDMPVVNQIQIADRAVFTPLPSVFQAGQWAYSPAGVPMSILTGKMAADKVLRSQR